MIFENFMIQGFSINSTYSILIKIEYVNEDGTQNAMVGSQLGIRLCNDSKINIEEIQRLHNTTGLRNLKILEKYHVHSINYIQMLYVEKKFLPWTNN